ncbi:MAG: methyltransferase domain-containing protein [Acidimicrobiia bacterium]|nr:methyltransferase domain-containing protein [Acidimicrobiia bacterium]
MTRTSTARAANAGRRGFTTVLESEFPHGGRVLNLGAGLVSWARDTTTVVNVDHVPGPRHPAACQVVADAGHLPFRAGSFTGVLAKDVLEHLVDPVPALALLHDVTAPGAMLIATVPRAVPRAVWDDPTHVRGFTANAVRTAMGLSGWRVRTLGRIGGFPGAGRLGLTPYLELIMKVPGFGHRFGTNWLVRAQRIDEGPGG